MEPETYPPLQELIDRAENERIRTRAELDVANVTMSTLQHGPERDAASAAVDVAADAYADALLACELLGQTAAYLAKTE